MSKLEAIIEYNMPEQHAKAFKIALMWEKHVNVVFPKYRATKLPKKGDPRNGTLFRHCLKLVRETTGIIPDNEYELYVEAQLLIFKAISNNGAVLLVEPHILSGKPAWRRWKLWKRRYDLRENTTQPMDHTPLVAQEEKVIAALKKTKEFLLKEYKGLPTQEQFHNNLIDGTLVRFITLGKISPYYVLLTPLISREFIDKLKFDLSIYENDITDNVKYFFRNELQ
jgi:hypothetical protein